MKLFSKSSHILLVIGLALFLSFQNIQSALADGPVDQTITVGTSAPASAAYGASFTVAATATSGLDVSYSASGDCTSVGDTFTMTAGTGTCTVQYDQAGDGINYNAAPQVTENVTAQLAAVTVTADPQSKAFGAADPALTYSVTAGALVSPDVFSGDLARDAGEAPGTYAITQGTLSLSANYDLTYQGANLTIDPAPVTISGSLGVAGAGLAYFDGTAKTVLSGSDGSYSFQVSYLWSGTVTPSLYGYTFVPAFKTYSSVAADMPGQNYAAVLIMTPLPQAPLGTLTMNRPTYQWTRVVGAKQYQIQLELGSKVIYIKTLPATACVVNLCSNKPTTALADGAYKWRVRALIGTTWHAYSGFMAFKINTKPMAGYWAGSSEDFFVVPQQNAVKTFAIYITVQGCGNYKIWHSALAPIVNKHFAFSGALYASGAFSSLSAAKGVFGLNGLVIRGCGTLRGGPLSWRTSWINASQSFVPATVEVTSQELLPHGFDAWMPFITIQVVNP